MDGGEVRLVYDDAPEPARLRLRHGDLQSPGFPETASELHTHSEPAAES